MQFFGSEEDWEEEAGTSPDWESERNDEIDDDSDEEVTDIEDLDWQPGKLL